MQLQLPAVDHDVRFPLSLQDTSVLRHDSTHLPPLKAKPVEQVAQLVEVYPVAHDAQRGPANALKHVHWQLPVVRREPLTALARPLHDTATLLQSSAHSGNPL